MLSAMSTWRNTLRNGWRTVVATVRVNATVLWRRLVICPAMTTSQVPNYSGGYAAWFCDRRRGHSGAHYDRNRGMQW
jgi:hypothetical protein